MRDKDKLIDAMVREAEEARKLTKDGGIPYSEFRAQILNKLREGTRD